MKLPSNVGDQAWGLNGNIVNVSVNPKDSIISFKNSLSKVLASKNFIFKNFNSIYIDMPVNLMRLKAIGGEEIADNQTIAFYNLPDNEII